MLSAFFPIFSAVLFVMAIMSLTACYKSLPALRFAATLFVQDNQLLESIVDNFHRRISFLFLCVTLRFVLEPHQTFRGRTEFHRDFLTLDDDIDFSDSVH